MAKGFVGVRLPPELIDAAKLAAESEHRTLSNYILTLIDADIRRREHAGELKEAPTQAPVRYQPKRTKRRSIMPRSDHLEQLAAQQGVKLKISPAPKPSH